MLSGVVQLGFHPTRFVGACHHTRTQDHLACWTRTRSDFSLTYHNVQRARWPPSRRAISRGSFMHGGGAPAHSSLKSWASSTSSKASGVSAATCSDISMICNELLETCS